jgi:hypothetical protein
MSFEQLVSDMDIVEKKAIKQQKRMSSYFGKASKLVDNFMRATNENEKQFLGMSGALTSWIRRVTYSVPGAYRVINKLNASLTATAKVWETFKGSVRDSGKMGIFGSMEKLDLGKFDLQKKFKEGGGGKGIKEKFKGYEKWIMSKEGGSSFGGIFGEKAFRKGKARQDKVSDIASSGVAGLLEPMKSLNKVGGFMWKLMGKVVKGLWGKTKMFLSLSLTILSKMFNFFIIAMLFFGAVGLALKIIREFWPALQSFWETVSKPFMEFGQIVIDMFMQFWTTIKTIWGFFTGEKSFEQMAFSLLDSLLGILRVVVAIVTKVAIPIIIGLGKMLIKAGGMIWEKFMALGWKKKVGVIVALAGLVVAWLYGLPIIFPLIIIGALFYFGKWLLKKIGFLATGGTTSKGLNVVGERGPELVKLPIGSRVHSNTQSRKIVSGSGNSVINNHITINARDTSDAELRRIATKLSGMINSKVNRTTSSRTMG